MKINLKIPSDLNSVTLGQYQDLKKIKEPTNEDLISTLFSIPKNDIKYIKDEDVDMLIEKIDSLFDKDPLFTSIFHLGDTQYGFIPNLDDITYGENKDITTYINDWDNMHIAMSVLYRPITKKKGNKYLIEDYTGEENVDIMKQMPLGVVLGSMVFFYNLTSELLRAIPNYLQMELTKAELTPQQQVTLQENGEALAKSILYLKETLPSLMK